MLVIFFYFVANKYIISLSVICIFESKSESRGTTIVLLLAKMRIFGRKLLACSLDSKPTIAIPMINWEMVPLTPHDSF